MAIYHLSQKIGKRAQGKNAVFAVAYIRGEQRTCLRTNETKDFTAKQGELIYSNCILPTDAPEWASKVRNAQVQDATGALTVDKTGHTFSEMAWNQIELMEKRQDAQLYFHYDIAIPIELEQSDAIALIEQYVKDTIAVDGFFCDVAIHWDLHNPHAHLVSPMRTLTETGYSNKIRMTRQQMGDDITAKREGWAKLTNQMLMARGIDARIDHRSNEARGIQLIPTIKIGKATHMTGSEHQQLRIAENQAIRAKNYATIASSPDILATKLAQEHHTFSRDTVRDELQKYAVEKAVLDAMQHNESASREKIVADIIQHLSEQEVVFSERELKSHVLEMTNGNADFEAIANAVTAAPTILSLGLGEDGREHYVTRAAFDLELSLIDNAKALAGQSTFTLDKSMAAQVAKPFGLNPSQKNAFDHIVHGANAAVITGFAGTGKTYMLNAARAAWEQAGYRVRGVAFSGRAAEALGEDANMKTMTCAGFLTAMEKGYIKLGTKDVLVMDEMGMTSLDDCEAIIRLVKKAGAKFVGVGDTEQTQPVGRGAPMRTVIGTIGASEMSTIVRHQGADADWMTAATLAMETRQTASALDAYQQRGYVQLLENFDAALDGSVAAWAKHIDTRDVKTLQETILIAAENETVATQNRLARQHLMDAGYLKTEVRVATKAGALFVAEGERLLFGYGAKPYKARNGQFGTLTGMSDKTLFVTLDNEKQIELPRDKTLDMTYGYAATTHKLQGFTGDRAIPLIDSRNWDRHKTLVAASRHRFGLELFADLETFEDYDDLREVLSREGLSDSVIDYPTTFALRRGFDSDATGKRVVAKVREHLAPVANAWLFLTNYAAYLEKHPATTVDTAAVISARRKRAVLVAEFADTRIALAKTMTELVPLQDAQAEHLLRFAILQEAGLSPVEHQVMRKTLDDAVALIPEIERLQQAVHLAHMANAKRAQTIAADIDDFKPALDKNRITLRVLQKAVAVGEAADTIKDVVTRFHLNQFYAPTLADTVTADWSTYYPHIVNAFPERHWLATLTSNEKTRDDFMAMLASQADNHRFDTAVATFGTHHKGEIATLKYYADLHRETMAKVAAVEKNTMRCLLPYLILQEVGFSPVRHTLMREMLDITVEAGAALAPEKAKLHQLSLKRDRAAKACMAIDDTERRDRLFAHFGLDIEKVAAHATRIADRALVKRFSRLPGSTYNHENRLKQRLAYTISQAPKRYGPYLNDFFKAQDDDSDAPDGWQIVNLEKWRYQKYLARVTATAAFKPHLVLIDHYYRASRQVSALWQRAIRQRNALDATVLRHLQDWDFTQPQTAEHLHVYQASVQARLARTLQAAQQATIARDKAAARMLSDVAGNAALLANEKVDIKKVSVRANAYQTMMRYRQATDEDKLLSLASAIMQSPKTYHHYIGRFDLADDLHRESRTQAMLIKAKRTLTVELRLGIAHLEAYESARRLAGQKWAALKTLQKIAGASDARQCPAGLQPLLAEAKAASLKTNHLAHDYVQYSEKTHLDVNLYGYALDCDKVQVAAQKHIAYENVQTYLAGDSQTQVRLSAVILDDKASYQYCYEFGLDFTRLHRQAVTARTLTAAQEFPTLTAGDIRIATDYAHLLQTLSQQYQALKTERNRLRQINDAYGNALDIHTREPLKVAYPTSPQLESLQQTLNQLSITRDTLAHQLMSPSQLAPLIEHFRLKPDTVASHAQRFADRQAVKAFDALADSTWQVPNLQKQARAHHFKTERKRYGVHFTTTLKNGWRDVNLENWRYEQRMACHRQTPAEKAHTQEVLRYKAACRDAAAAWKTAFAHKAAHKGQHPARSYQIAQGRSHFRNKLASQLVANGLERYESQLIALNVDIAKLCERQHTFDTFARYLSCDDPARKLRLAHGLAQNITAHRAALAVHPLYGDIQKEARLYQYLQQQKVQPTAALLATVDMLEAYRTLKSRAGKAWYDAKALEAKSHKKAADAFTAAADLQSQRNESAFKVMRYIHDSQGIAFGEYAIDVAALEKAAEQHVAEQAVVAYREACGDKKGEAAYHLLKNRSAYHFIYRHGIDFTVLREQSDTWLMSDAVTLEAKTETQVIERKRWDVERIDAALRADPHTFYRTLLGEPKRADSKTLDYGSGLKVELRGRYAGNWRDWAAGVGGGPIKALEVHQGLSFKDALEQGARMAGLSDTAAMTLDATVVQKKVLDSQLARDKAAAKERQLSIASAQSIWAGTVPLSGTLSARYLSVHRGIANTASLDIRHWPAGAMWQNVAADKTTLMAKENKVPAAVMAIRDAQGDVTAVQRIYLDKQTGGKNTFMETPKLSKGVIQGSAGLVQQGQPGAPLYIVEGPETGASVAAVFPEATVLASTGVSHLRHMTCAILRYQPSHVVMAADNDGVGAASMKTTEAAFETLKTALGEHNIAVSCMYPTAIAGLKKTDWNDVYQQQGADEVKAQLQSSRQSLAPGVDEAVSTGYAFAYSAGEKFCREDLGLIDVDLSAFEYDPAICDLESEQVVGGIKVPMVGADGKPSGEAIYACDHQTPTLSLVALNTTMPDPAIAFQVIDDSQRVFITDTLHDAAVLAMSDHEATIYVCEEAQLPLWIAEQHRDIPIYVAAESSEPVVLQTVWQRTADYRALGVDVGTVSPREQAVMMPIYAHYQASGQVHDIVRLDPLTAPVQTAKPSLFDALKARINPSTQQEEHHAMSQPLGNASFGAYYMDFSPEEKIALDAYFSAREALARTDTYDDAVRLAKCAVAARVALNEKAILLVEQKQPIRADLPHSALSTIEKRIHQGQSLTLHDTRALIDCLLKPKLDSQTWDDLKQVSQLLKDARAEDDAYRAAAIDFVDRKKALIEAWKADMELPMVGFGQADKNLEKLTDTAITRNVFLGFTRTFEATAQSAQQSLSETQSLDRGRGGYKW